MRIEDYLKEYEEMLFKEGKSAKTVQTYLPNINLFLGYLSESSNTKEVNEIRLKDIEDFIDLYKRKGNSKRSINLKLSAILSFVKHLNNQGVIEYNLEEEITQLRVKLPRLPDHKVFSDEEIDILRKVVYKERNYQHIIILELMLLGLKPQTIVDMRVTDVIDTIVSDDRLRLNTGNYKVLKGIEDDTSLVIALKELFRHRKFKNIDEEYLLISEKRRKYQVAGLRYIINNYMSMADVSLKDYDLNSFRHHYLKKCFDKSIDAIDVANQISLTSEYVSRIFNKFASTH